jgi:hypothetical protein
MKYLALGVLAAAGLSGAQDTQTFRGTITDDMCALGGHAAMRMGPTDAECARLCVMIHGGAFVLDDGSHAYTLSDQARAEQFAAQAVTVSGTLDAENGTIRVESIAAAR